MPPRKFLRIHPNYVRLCGVAAPLLSTLELRAAGKPSTAGDSITEQHLYSILWKPGRSRGSPPGIRSLSMWELAATTRPGAASASSAMWQAGASAMTVNFGMKDYHIKVTGPKPGRYDVRLGGVKVADYSATELGAGVNLAGAVLTAGPIADQVKAAGIAINAKNSYFHDRIFGGVPDFLEISPEQVEAKRLAVFNERMEKLPEQFAAIKKTLVMQAHRVKIVEAK